jgi:hypothetical protein
MGIIAKSGQHGNQPHIICHTSSMDLRLDKILDDGHARTFILIAPRKGGVSADLSGVRRRFGGEDFFANTCR